jgi:hypothetical protein
VHSSTGEREFPVGLRPADAQSQVSIIAAERYKAAPDLAVITSYFNPEAYSTKRRNYERFIASMNRSGIAVTSIECAFGNSPFQLALGPNIIRVRSQSVLWQKERILNAAMRRLDSSVKKIAWIDADILFSNPDWAVETSRVLDSLPVVQPFSQSVRLPRGVLEFDGRGLIEQGFASCITKSPHAVTVGVWEQHGQTGFAWAARREILKYGLYDRAIAGGGDHLMAHAFVGDWESGCMAEVMLGNSPYRKDYERWCSSVYPLVRSRIGFVAGSALHLWHGMLANRQYRDRAGALTALGFNPAVDIRLGRNGCWEWASHNVSLQRWSRNYFSLRKEDTVGDRKTSTRAQLLSRIRRYQDRAENAQLTFWVNAALSAERAIRRAPSVRRAREVAEDFFAWCADQAW